MKKQRPVNLDLSTLKFPPMAIASILHRISGILIFLLLPPMLYFLSLTLKSEASFMEFQLLLADPYVKSIIWVFASAALYHLIAGVRHMVMDLGFGESLHAGRVGAILVIILGFVATIMVGLWLW